MSINLETLSREELIELVSQSKKETIKYVNKYLEEEEKRDILRFLLLNISHEFKTPLNSIIGFSEILKMRCSNSEDYRCLENISYSSKHLLALIQDFLDVTRSQYCQLEVVRKNINTREIILNIINSFCSIQIDYTLSDVTLYADEVRFRQVVYNLLSNAIKFNAVGAPIKILTYVEDKGFVFEITDYGEGIAEEDKSIIFDFFSQASYDLTKRQAGSGVGLALCKSIIEAHNGIISVESVKSLGSTFRFYIPLEV